MPNRPTDQQILRLQEALLSAFDDLSRLTLLCLGTELEKVVPSQARTRTQVCYDLIRVCAAKEGGLHRLMDVALKEAPENKLLASVVAELRPLEFAVLPLPEDFRGRDIVHGDKIEGSKYTVGDITDGVVAIGDNAKVIVVKDTDTLLALEEEQRVRNALLSGTFDRLPFEPETVLIPNGPFLMGSDDDDASESPQHQLVLPAYRMGKFPVTNAEYAEFVRQTRHQAPQKAGWFLNRAPEGQENYPVVAISWEDACAYCDWLSRSTARTYRLPTEAEWEKAARGADGQRYPWPEAAHPNWVETCVNLQDKPTAVDAHPAGSSPYGCLDMLGNVQEWTLTIWGSDENVNDFPYPYGEPHGTAARRNETDATRYTTGIYRIHRGGSHRSRAAELRSSARSRSRQESKVAWRGFRVMMEI